MPHAQTPSASFALSPRALAAIASLLCALAALPAAAFEWSGKLAEATREIKSPDPARRAASLRGLVYFDLASVQGHLLDALDDQASLVQLAAMDSLVEVGAYDAAPKLHRFLTDTDPVLRIGAVNALSELGGVAEVDAMIRTLGDGEPKVRAATVRALGRLGFDRARAPIATMLSDVEPEVVIVAIEVLARIGDQTAVFPLLEKVKDPQVRVQLAAIQALGRLKDPRAVLPLVGLLYSPHDDIQFAVVDALGRLKDPRATGHLVKLMWAEHKTPLGSRVIYALGDIGDPSAADPLLQVMRFGDTARAAADALKKIGPAATASILEALRLSHDPNFQRLCLGALQYIQSLPECGRDERRLVARALIPELGAQRLPTDAAATALLAGRDPDALGPALGLLEGLLDAPGEIDDPLRLDILRGLSAFEDARLTRPLLLLLPRLNPEEQRLAIEALGKTGAPEAIEPIGGALREGDVDAQRAAARALGRIDDPRAGRLLLEQLRADRSYLLADVAFGLGSNTSPEIAAALLEITTRTSGEVLFSALQALAEHYRRAPTPEAAALLLDLVDDARDERVAARAADALGPHPAPGGVKVLAGRYKTAGVMLRTRIVQVLGDWRDPSARDTLLDALKARSPALRGEAAWALGQLGDPADAALLTPLLTDDRWPVASNAAAALARLKSAQGLDENLEGLTSFARVNALLALHRAGQPPSRERMLKLAHQEADPRLQEAVARVLIEQGGDENLQAARRLRQSATDPATTALIDRLLGDAPPDADGEGWIRYVFTDAGRRMVSQRVILVLPDGVLLGRSSDAAGEVRVEHLDGGQCRIIFLDEVFTQP